MKLSFRAIFITLLLSLGQFASPASGATVQLLENGDFETGDFSSWSISSARYSGGTYEQAIVPFDVTGDTINSNAAKFRVGSSSSYIGVWNYWSGIILEQSVAVSSQSNLNFSVNIANVITGAVNPGNLASGGFFELLFDGTVLTSFQTGLIPVAIERLSLSANLLDVAAGDYSVGVRITKRHIYSEFTPAQYLDNISLLSSTNNLSPVPVPAALPLFGSGMAIIGFFGWRRRQDTHK